MNAADVQRKDSDECCNTEKHVREEGPCECDKKVECVPEDGNAGHKQEMAHSSDDGRRDSEGADPQRRATKRLSKDEETCDEGAAEHKIGINYPNSDQEHAEQHASSETSSDENMSKPSETSDTLCDGRNRKRNAASQAEKENENRGGNAPRQNASSSDGSGDQLTRIVELLLQKCGKHADLVLDVILDQTTDEFQPVQVYIRNAVDDQVGVAASLETVPLLKLVQERLPRCTHCSPFGNLLVQSVSTSGSVMEGLSNESGVLDIDSDLDTMFEFGPIRVETADNFYTHDRPASTSPPSPPCVIIVPTKNPGFVMLMQPRTPDCPHEHDLFFSAEAFYRLDYSSVRFEQSSSEEVFGDTGPSAEIHRRVKLGFDGNDSVPCLRAAWWPADEFVTRERKQDWPPAKAREDIRLYGVHLVAKSAPGTALVYFQWRISFSRAEVVAAWYLTLQQRGALRALKRCKALLGQSGKGVKSYFMKTSLFWLCQEIPSAEWTSAVEGARRILDFLEAAVDARCLPCFFWADINVFQFLSVKELEVMKETIGILRASMDWLLMSWVAKMLSHFVEPVLRHPMLPVPERELRVCLVRALVSYAIWRGIRRPYESAWMKQYAKFWVPRLLASSAQLELQTLYHKDLGTTFLQTTLFRALLVAPEEVLASTRVTQLPSGLIVLDPTPLVSLLQPGDVLELLEEPLRVVEWCRRQHTLPPAERPPGVPDHINTPRGFCDLALRPALLRRALCESVPWFRTKLQVAEFRSELHIRNFKQLELTFAERFDDYELTIRNKYGASVEARLQRALGLDEATTCAMAALWREELDRLLADPAVRAEYRRKCATLPDSWQLRKYVFNN